MFSSLDCTFPDVLMVDCLEDDFSVPAKIEYKHLNGGSG